jgi:hypothetical protein
MGAVFGEAGLCTRCRFRRSVFAIVKGALQGNGETTMPRYISQHTLACLTRQGAAELTRRVHAARQVTARRVLLNMQEGKMLIEFDAPGREDLEKWLAAEKFHFDWLLRVEYESADGELRVVP